MANFDGLAKTNASLTPVKDAAKSTDSTLETDIFKSVSIKTNLPSDNLGFWLTQGVPTGLIMTHVVMQLVGETDVGICFVPSTRDNQLDNSQIQYITQFCLNQASDHGCVVNGSLKDECKFNGSTLCDMNTTDPTRSYNKIDFFDSLFLYRNYVWFLFIFAFVRGIPRILWSLYFAAEIALAIEVTTIFAGRGHSGDNLKIEELEKLHKKKGIKRCLFWYYIARKLFEIALDVAIISLIGAFLTLNNTPYHKLVFVCDLHKDLNNLLLCDIITNRFISCTVSFGFEFIMTVGMQLAVFSFDLLFQTGFLIYLSGPKRVLECLCKILTCCKRKILRLRKSDSEYSELKEDKNKETEFNVTSMYSLKDLRLISMLQKQNCMQQRQKEDKDNSFEMIMVEKLIRGLAEPNETIPLQSGANRADQNQNGNRTSPEDGRGPQANNTHNNVGTSVSNSRTSINN